MPLTLPPPAAASSTATRCYHCGDNCGTKPLWADEKPFCCEGCKMVYQLLQENDLCSYYDLEKHPGIQLKAPRDQGAFAYLDHPEVEQKLLSFRSETMARATFSLPQVHCTSCVWLLEKLPRLHPGISYSRLDFLRKELFLAYNPEVISLRELVSLLASIGYEPRINLSDLHKSQQEKRNNRTFYLRLGVAGFCFGNIMLLSFPEYLGLTTDREAIFRSFFGYLNLLLALPVLLFSSAPFFISAWQGLRQRSVNIDVPISLGILALFGRSAFEILSGTGAGYMDSLAALIFFLLSGRWFQNRTYDSLSFDRDYRAYFPVSTTRLRAGAEESVPVTQLAPGDTILVRSQELIPADAVLLSSEARIDYSFVTGESEPVLRKSGDLIYAGGRQVAASVELTLVRGVSQSYLTQLWEQAAGGGRHASIQNFTDRLGRRFTWAVLALATLSGGGWLWQGGVADAVHVFTSVLIVACPCALALAAPITLGNALRIMGRRRLYARNTEVLERMAEVNHVVLDKTGTLTYKGAGGEPELAGSLGEEERLALASLARQSAHPLSQAVARWASPGAVLPVAAFEEKTGAGIRGEVEGRSYLLGKGAWASACYPGLRGLPEDLACVVIDGEFRATLRLPQRLREGLGGLLGRLGQHFRLSLLSGDNDREAAALRPLFPAGAEMRFRQSPHDKKAYIRSLGESGAKVLMVGDGLNDAGALLESHVGIAVSEHVDAFSPACDAIIDASRLTELDRMLAFARQSMRLLRGGLLLSLAYNVVGLSIAMQGLLSPVVAAILMPLSSVTIVVYGLAATQWAGRKLAG